MLSVLRGAGLLKAALGLTGLIATMAGAGAEELIVGVVGPQSGPGAVFGVDQVRAAELAAKIANSKGGILGRTVKVIARDSQNESTMADTQAFRDLAGNNAHFVVGFASSAVCNALGPVAQQLSILYFGQCSDPSLLGANGPQNYYMAANVVLSSPLGIAQIVESKYRDIPCWAVYSLDYVTGHTVANAFKSALKAKLPQATTSTEVFAPLSATDVRPYINALSAAATDHPGCGLYVYAYGGSGVNFIKQAVIENLFSRYKIFAWHGADDANMNGVGSKLPRFFSVGEFFPPAYAGISGANKEATAGWKNTYGVDIPWQAYASYDGALAIFAAINKAGTVEIGKVQAALSGLTFDSIKGPITIKNRYMIQTAAGFECQGDAAAHGGWSCSGGEVLPATAITPPQYQ
jgi:ABC-type branched-subunit amino acid transport system substrate-binding protein